MAVVAGIMGYFVVLRHQSFASHSLAAVIARPLLFASLDPSVAEAQGVPVRLLGLGFMALLAVTVSMATMAVGALLVFALLLLPAAMAYQMSTRPFVALALSASLGIVLAWIGIAIGFYTGYPSSVCISLLSFMGYVVVVGGRAGIRGIRVWAR